MRNAIVDLAIVDLALRDEKNFPGVRIFHFLAGTETFDIDKFSRRVRTLDQMRFAGNWNAVGKIAFRFRGRSGSRRGPSGRVFRGGSRGFGLGRTVGIERLLLRRIGRRRLTLRRIFCDLMLDLPRRFIDGIAGGNEEGSEQRKREFHNGIGSLDERIRLLIRCQCKS